MVVHGARTHAAAECVQQISCSLRSRELFRAGFETPRGVLHHLGMDQVAVCRGFLQAVLCRSHHTFMASLQLL